MSTSGIIEEEEEEKYPQETLTSNRTDETIPAQTSQITIEPNHNLTKEKNDPRHEMLMQKLVNDKQKNESSESKCKLIFCWLLIVSIFVCYVVPYFGDKPFIKATVDGQKFHQFAVSVHHGIPRNGNLETEWFSDKIQILTRGLVGRTLRGGATTSTINRVPCNYKDLNQQVLQLILTWCTIIPMIMAGICVLLTTVRFCFINKILSQKLKYATIRIIGFAGMGPIFIIIDLLVQFTQLEGNNTLGLGKEDWHFGLAAWSQVVALCLMLFLEFFDLCF